MSVFYTSSQFPRWLNSSDPQSNGQPCTIYWLFFLSHLCSFLTYSYSKLNYLYLNIFLRVCFLGIPRLTELLGDASQFLGRLAL